MPPVQLPEIENPAELPPAPNDPPTTDNIVEALDLVRQIERGHMVLDTLERIPPRADRAAANIYFYKVLGAASGPAPAAAPDPAVIHEAVQPLIQGIRDEFRNEMQELRNELRGDMDELRGDVTVLLHLSAVAYNRGCLGKGYHPVQALGRDERPDAFGLPRLPTQGHVDGLSDDELDRFLDYHKVELHGADRALKLVALRVTIGYVPAV